MAINWTLVIAGGALVLSVINTATSVRDYFRRRAKERPTVRLELHRHSEADNRHSVMVAGDNRSDHVLRVVSVKLENPVTEWHLIPIGELRPDGGGGGYIDQLNEVYAPDNALECDLVAPPKTTLPTAQVGFLDHTPFGTLGEHVLRFEIRYIIEAEQIETRASRWTRPATAVQPLFS